MKKFIIRDEGKEYEVEEVETKTTEPTTQKPTTDDESLTSEETLALKKLASVADKLVAMVAKADCSATDDDEDKDDVDDEDKNTDEDDEAVIDTDETEADETVNVLKKDSKKSVGSIQKKIRNDDSLDAQELDVASAWAKRYGGNK